MKQLFIIGNWKTYPMELTPGEWVAQGMKQKAAIEKSLADKQQMCTIIVCPPASRLHAVADAIKQHNAQDFIKIAAQDISAFPPGAHTGDESGQELQEKFGITYTLLGHSERRRDYGETDALLAKKVAQALENNIIPIYCVQDEKDTIPEGVTIVAYEPPYAISAMSGGVAEDPQKTEFVANIVREKLTALYKDTPQETYVLYGGSVNANNVASFTNNPKLAKSFDGALVGAKSLIPEFFHIVENA